MARWLIKSDPDDYSFSDLAREKRTRWNGVRNALALRHLGAMKRGDELLVYESGKVKAVVGRARVARAPYPDPEAGDERLLVVDLAAGAALAAPVTLSAIRSDPAFAEFGLVRISRLSVMPVPDPLWDRILEMAGG